MDVYFLVEIRLAKATDYMELISSFVVWHPILRRAAYDLEIPHIYRLMEKLSHVVTCVNQADERRWWAGDGGIFSVKSYYSLIEFSRGIGIPWKAIWY